MPDPYYVHVATEELADMATAFDVVDAHADLGARYRTMLADSRRMLAAPEVRLTQARGLAKRLLVLAKAAGPTFREGLDGHSRTALDSGLSQAHSLLQRSD